jgi:hypothetical protein
MKLPIAITLSVIISCTTSWYLTYLYNQSQKEDASEDVVSSEVMLLEKARGFLPPCATLAKDSDLVVKKEGDYILIWKVARNKKFIEKFVVNKDFDSAYEQVENTCLVK